MILATKALFDQNNEFYFTSEDITGASNKVLKK
jgi:hypothetical protein